MGKYIGVGLAAWNRRRFRVEMGVFGPEIGPNTGFEVLARSRPHALALVIARGAETLRVDRCRA